MRRSVALIACGMAMATIAACGPDGTDETAVSTTTVTSTRSAIAAAPSGSASDPTDGGAATGEGDPTGPTDVADPTVPTALTAAEANVRLEDYRVNDEGIGPGYFFRSPTGNVTCGVHDREPEFGFGCQAQVSVQNERGPKCKNGGNSVYATFIVNGAVGSRCVNQPFYNGTYVNKQNVITPSRVLAYGQVLSVGGVTCESTTAGITCFQGSLGFTMSRDRNDSYGPS